MRQLTLVRTGESVTPPEPPSRMTQYLSYGQYSVTVDGVDLSSPLRSLIPTLDSAVLDVLAGTESALSLAQLSKMATHGSRAGLSLALDRLVEQGLVSALPANRGSLYRLNRDHVLAEAVTTAAAARQTILSRLVAQVQQMNPTPEHVSVFGSFARREAGAGSDIDVLFILAHTAPDAWFEQVGELAQAVYSWTGNRLEYLVFSLDEFAGVVHRGEPIVDSWLADSITVYGRDLEALTPDAATGTQR